MRKSAEEVLRCAQEMTFSSKVQIWEAEYKTVGNMSVMALDVELP